MKIDQYGSIKDLLSVSDTVQKNKTRIRRPSPALGAITDSSGLPESPITPSTLNSNALEYGYNHKITKNKEDIVLLMPVSKKKIPLSLYLINPSKIDVSIENERIQKFLDEISLHDILESIKKNGQQKPGLLRPKQNNRFELIEGSRRLASVKYLQRSYLAFVGDIPDEDVLSLSRVENEHKKISAYERAKFYQKQIEIGIYKNWTKLGESYRISSSHISRYRACVELDDIFLKILPCISDMPLSYGESISILKKANKKALLKAARTLLNQRNSSLDNHSYPISVDETIKILKKAVDEKKALKTKNETQIYHFKNGILLKYFFNKKGVSKFELKGVNEKKYQQILSHLIKNLEK